MLAIRCNFTRSKVDPLLRPLPILAHDLGYVYLQLSTLTRPWRRGRGQFGPNKGNAVGRLLQTHRNPNSFCKHARSSPFQPCWHVIPSTFTAEPFSVNRVYRDFRHYRCLDGLYTYRVDFPVLGPRLLFRTAIANDKQRETNWVGKCTKFWVTDSIQLLRIFSGKHG